MKLPNWWENADFIDVSELTSHPIFLEPKANMVDKYLVKLLKKEILLVKLYNKISLFAQFAGPVIKGSRIAPLILTPLVIGKSDAAAFHDEFDLLRFSYTIRIHIVAFVMTGSTFSNMHLVAHPQDDKSFLKMAPDCCERYILLMRDSFPCCNIFRFSTRLSIFIDYFPHLIRVIINNNN